MNTKPWYFSRTLWFNLLVLALSTGADNWSLLQGMLPSHFYTWVAFALPVVNILLRTITSQGLHLTAPDTGAGGKVN